MPWLDLESDVSLLFAGFEEHQKDNYAAALYARWLAKKKRNAARFRDHYRRNKETIAKARRARRTDHTRAVQRNRYRRTVSDGSPIRDRFVAGRRRYREQNIDAIRERSRRYYAEHREQYAAAYRKKKELRVPAHEISWNACNDSSNIGPECSVDHRNGKSICFRHRKERVVKQS